MGLFRKNPVIVITGGSGGIGSVIAERLAEVGARMVICDFDQPEPYNFDVSDRDGWRKMFKAVVDEYGQVDALLNNAGVQTKGTDTALELADDEWERVMEIDVNSVRLGMSEAMKAMGDKGGRIISTASVAGYRPQPGGFVYSTSKAAVIAMTKQAAIDFTSKGFLINAVAPGMMENVMAKGKPGPLRDKVIGTSLTKEAVKRTEIAAAYEFLLDERITSIVGTTLHVDGGLGLFTL